MKYLLIILIIHSIGVSFSQTSLLISSNDNELITNFSFENSELITKEYKGNSYVDFSLTSSNTLSIKGAPALPYFAKSVILPQTGNSKLTVEYDDIIEYKNINVLPSLGLQKRKTKDVNYEFGETYLKNEFYPGTLAKNSKPFILRELRGQTILLYPYQYNPITKTLRFYKNLRVTLKFDNQNGVNEIHSQVNSHLGEIYFSDQFINSNKHKNKYLAKTEVGEMLVICPESYKQNLQPFVDWKNQKGIKTSVQTVESIGNNSTLIKAFINDFYKQNPSLLYLLLVGDAEDLTPYTYGNFSSDEYWSDSYYGQLTGNDYYSELFVGRFSGTPIEVKTMVERTLEYEKNPAAGEWMTRALGIASSQGAGIGDNGEADWQHERLIRSTLMETDYSYVYELYDGNQGILDSPNNPTNTEIINVLNSGIGLFNYTGHGDTDYFVTGNFYSSDVLSATNFGSYPFIISVACNNGKFVNNKCIAETWLSAKNQNKITGAIAMCGSSILMDWAPPMKTQDEIVRLLSSSETSIRKSTLGGIFNNGQFSMLEKYGTDGEGVIQTWVFFGDPSTLFRNQLTKPISCSIDLCSDCSTKSITITSSIEGVQIGISKNSQWVETGEIKNNTYTYTFPISEKNENYTFTLTKQNYTIKQLEMYTFLIYPNPANKIITIKNTKPYTLKILSIDGKLIDSYPTQNDLHSEIDISHLSNGSYIFQFEMNGNVHTEKVNIAR